MFGLRYHVASLAAVFVALAVGILLGVAISGKVSEAEESFERSRAQELEADVRSANERADAAARSGAASAQLVERAYAALMEDRLDGRSVAVVFLGPAEGSMRAEIERALADADGGAPLRVVALDVPVDGPDLQSALEGDELLAGYADDGGDFTSLGRELGHELVEGGDTPLWSTLSSRLVEERSGATSTPVDGVVVAATWMPPAEPGDGEAADEAAATSTLLAGLVQGVDSAGVPAVGVAASEDPPRVVDLYRDEGISSVDALDSTAGRLALALLLAGAAPGHYGIGPNASDGVVPPIEPLPAPLE